jgi:hypothetical protein
MIWNRFGRSDRGRTRAKLFCEVRAAAFGAKRPFGEPTITLEAKAWLTSLSCRKAKELGHPHELWTTRLLARHAREHGPAEGHPRLANTKNGRRASSRARLVLRRLKGRGVQILAIERQDVERLDFVIVLARVQGIEIGNTVNPKDDSFAIDQLICNTEDNEKGFANVSEVTGYSRIKMEGVCKTR